MTEFVITLPIFILIFVGILQLGMFEFQAGQVWARAYKDTWAKAIPITQQQILAVDFTDPLQRHVHPATAGVESGRQLVQYAPHNDHTVMRIRTAASEATTYGSMASRGHWGESFERTRPAATHIRFRQVDALVTSDPASIVGNSGYARAILVDSASSSPVSSGGGGGALAQLDTMISGTGLRPVIGAGMRYGTVTGVDEFTYDALGLSMNMRAHFNTLVSPHPVDPRVTTAVTRMALQGQAGYRELLGISENQPLRRASSNVPNLPR